MKTLAASLSILTQQGVMLYLLRGVITSIRKEIESLGGEVH